MNNNGSHPSRSERRRMKAQVLDALAQLREILPLQRRIGSAPPAVRSVYRGILAQWLCEGTPPQAAHYAPQSIDALVQLDAVVVQDNGLGCYPFSADPTDFLVRNADGGRVHAFCAIDALAIPGLMGRSAGIASRCASCGRPLTCDAAEDGALTPQPLDHTAVVWEPGERTLTGDACCRTLCRRIRFMCSTCAGWSRERVFTLPQAAVIANAFFSFQRRFMDSGGASHE